QVQRARVATSEFFDAIVAWQAQHGATNGRLRRAPPIRDVLGEELRKLATAIGRGAEGIAEEEQRVELVAAQERCETLAASLARWLAQEEPDTVSWIDLEGGHGPRRRVTLACAPLDVGPILRRELFDRVPTCVLTSATLSVGSPPSFT